MRKAQKKQIEDFVELLFQVHDEIRDAITKHKNDEAMGLLAQCQDGAVKLGELIEGSEGEGCPTIHFLEEYCELTYQIYSSLDSGEGVNVNNVYKKLRKSLIQMHNSVKNDIIEKKVVVFLPYNATMWDSLESVWMAAHEDPCCDDYVIPIPYYDKNTDGTFREMHYDGDKYPEYVPITNFETYDFEAQHPDVIYIHNPYDEWNLVTSVHPFFYSKNLKKFTDMLVYIPYFVLVEVSPDNDEDIKKMEHFCLVPAVYNADKVIVQSEDMRKVYIKVLTKQSGESSRPIWEKKILGLGSPKLDKIAGTGTENINIPEDWQKIIQKPDGSMKKVIFYNTCITTLLNYNEKMLEKMEQVFNQFKENQDEVALLWRPHPLIKATVESMRPALWQEYDKLVRKYREEGWGIYDDTADLDRAIKISDAYYGDRSSVVQLFKETGKPIMIQSAEIL